MTPTALVTYSVKPRGGVVHTLHLAEALHEAGYPVRVVALGDPGAGFFRPVRAPCTIVPAWCSASARCSVCTTPPRGLTE